MRKKLSFQILIFCSLFFLIGPALVGSATIGQVERFNTESSFDQQSRREVTAILRKVSNELFFYLEEDWWNQLKEEERQRIEERIYNLGVEFEKNIYPRMTTLFGPKPNHPVDRSGRITILFHRMQPGFGGYFNSADQHSVFQSPRSNERNMLYISAEQIDNILLESILAHEFMHLLTFNQKERVHRVREEIWLNDVRAEFMPTLLGYDEREDSNLKRRIRAFLRQPTDSLTEWINKLPDYAVVNLFAQYLVDHYGIEILVNSFRSNRVGIESLNEALRLNRHNKSFTDVFTNWKIASLVNDCQLGERYCYRNPILKDVRITPWTTFLPTSYGASFSARNSTKNWAGNWQRVVGGRGDLILEFEGEPGLQWQVPYLLCAENQLCVVERMILDSQNRGEIKIADFGEQYESLTIMPSLQTKITDFNGVEREHFFSWRVSAEQALQDDLTLRQSLLRQITVLQAEVARLKNLRDRESAVLQPITLNLSFGARGEEVSRLQEFLRGQGAEIYPEGLVTGRFLTMTRRAVIRFQERHAAEILQPLGLSRGTGLVGEMTRKKINKLLEI